MYLILQSKTKNIAFSYVGKIKNYERVRYHDLYASFIVSIGCNKRLSQLCHVIAARILDSITMSRLQYLMIFILYFF